MNLEPCPLTRSEKFLYNLIDKEVVVSFKDGTSVVGTLIWNDKWSIGVSFTIRENGPTDITSWEENIYYFRSFIKSIKEKHKK